MKYDFISSQILNDQDWQNALMQGFAEKDTESTNQTRAARLRPLIEEGMQKELAEIEEIVSCPDLPTFANTIVRFTEVGGLLERATSVMYNLLSSDTDDELDALANEMAPKLSDHANRIMLNTALFQRVKYVYDNPPAQMTAEEKMLLDKTYEGLNAQELPSAMKIKRVSEKSQLSCLKPV